MLVQNLRDYAIFALDIEGKIVSWNEGARRISGYDESEIVGNYISILFTPEDLKAGKPQKELDIALKEGKYEDESWRVRKDGRLFWASVIVSPLYDEKREHLGFAKVIRDLSERRAVAEALRQSRETFDLMVSAIKDYAIFLLSAEGHVLSWNEGARRIKGYAPEEIIGKHFSIFYPPEANAIDHPAAELKLALKDGHYEEEGWRLRKDGTMFWASVTITPVLENDGTLRGFIKVTRDLTERREYEEALRKARDEAIKASRLKSQFVANISHEVRTPMAGLIGMAELLALDENLNEEQKEAADHIFNGSLKLLSVLNDLLDFSKLEAGRMDIDRSTFSVRNLVQEVKQSVLPPATKKHLEINTNIDESLPATIYDDEQKIRQCLLNLAHNAVKFTRQGAITIGVKKLKSEDLKDDMIEFTVIDTGVGVPAFAKELLFEPFVQADGSTRRKFGGTGLGLSIVKRFVELLGGTIGFNSEEGSGSTFWFRLPIREQGFDKGKTSTSS